jgi:hypothetical protein
VEDTRVMTTDEELEVLLLVVVVVSFLLVVGCIRRSIPMVVRILFFRVCVDVDTFPVVIYI